MDYRDLVFDLTDGVATLTLNRPERLNAGSPRLVFELIDAFERIDGDEDARVALVTGAGRAFCSGADQSGEGREDAAALREQAGYRRTTGAPIGHWGVLFDMLADYRKPIVAAVNGVAAGAGLSLALVADLRVASTEASFIAAFIRRGLVPDTGASYLLPRMIGPGRATEMMLTGDRVSAQQAFEWGLVNRLVEPDQLIPEATALARRIASGPMLAIELTKRLIVGATREDLAHQMEREAWGQSIASGSDDSREGVASFLEKREPHWKGR